MSFKSKVLAAPAAAACLIIAVISAERTFFAVMILLVALIISFLLAALITGRRTPALLACSGRRAGHLPVLAAGIGIYRPRLSRSGGIR